eukprot:356925-Chlamydomonas_euryale.AAC.10
MQPCRETRPCHVQSAPAGSGCGCTDGWKPESASRSAAAALLCCGQGRGEVCAVFLRAGVVSGAPTQNGALLRLVVALGPKPTCDLPAIPCDLCALPASQPPRGRAAARRASAQDNTQRRSGSGSYATNAPAEHVCEVWHESVTSLCIAIHPPTKTSFTRALASRFAFLWHWPQRGHSGPRLDACYRQYGQFVQYVQLAILHHGMYDYRPP